MEYTFYRIKSKNIKITEFYIGSTGNFDERKRKHKSNCNNENGNSYNCKLYQFIRSNGGWDEWDCEIIETLICSNTEKLLYKNKLMELYGATLNVYIPIITEYYTTDKEKLNQFHREERLKNEVIII